VGPLRQSILFVALHLVGVLVCLAIGPRRRVPLCCALGFPIGVAAVIIPALMLTALGVPYGRWSPLGVVVAVIAAAGLALRRRGAPTLAEARTIAIWTAAFAVICVAVTLINVSEASPDSHSILSLARVLVDDRGFGRGLMHRMANQGPFTIFAHSAAWLIGIEYLHSYAPVLGLSFVALFAVALADGLRALAVPRRVALVALITVALFTVQLLHFHFRYIHENLGSAVFLFTYVVLFWLAEVEDDVTPLPIAFLALTAFAIHRVENPITAVLFLAVTVVPSRLPRHAIAPWLAGFVAVVAGWNLVLALELPPAESMKLDTRRAAILIALVAAAAAYWAVAGATRLQAVNRRLPLIAAAACGVAVVATFALKPAAMTIALDAMIVNLTLVDDWGIAWCAVAALALLGLATPSPPARVAFTYGIPLHLVAILLLSFAHGAYTIKSNESASRMALHVLPLAFFYLGLKGGLLSRDTAPRTAAPAPAAPPLAAAR